VSGLTPEQDDLAHQVWQIDQKMIDLAESEEAIDASIAAAEQQIADLEKQKEAEDQAFTDLEEQGNALLDQIQEDGADIAAVRAEYDLSYF
jgi:chromosome segregation ATPase